jgi:hypothetical protein
MRTDSIDAFACELTSIGAIRNRSEIRIAIIPLLPISAAPPPSGIIRGSRIRLDSFLHIGRSEGRTMRGHIENANHNRANLECRGAIS